MNLPAALEDVKGVGIPQSLVEKSNIIRMNGGVQQLETMIRELPELLKRNEEIIIEVIFINTYEIQILFYEICFMFVLVRENVK